jgi:protein required for attachment to host cells
MILPHGAIVAVADGATLKLFRNQGAEPAIDLVALADPGIQPVNSGSGQRHHDANDNPDNDRRAEDRFAAGAAEHLNRLVLDGKAEKLLVIADPRTLGELRKGFHASVAGKLVGELSKNLIAHPVQDIVAAIRAA